MEGSAERTKRAVNAVFREIGPHESAVTTNEGAP